jgi:tripartite-type tricarboxylate transporter receptor subunit TctC
VRALAVTSKTRSQIFPDVPTMVEAGYPEIEGDGWVGILVPAGTPAEIIAILYRESAKILAQPDMKERLAALGCASKGIRESKITKKFSHGLCQSARRATFAATSLLAGRRDRMICARRPIS